MNRPIEDRRNFLKAATALGAAGAAGITGCAQMPTSGSAMKNTYDPFARYDVIVSETEFRRTAKGRQLMARIYRPQGTGPFPVVLDLHGGAWNAKNRFAEEPMNRSMAASGLLVVAIDLTLAAEAPYPACVQDANYGVRWLKAKAPQWGGDPSTLGVYGSSSGGHVAELLGMRPNDPRYNAIPLPEASHLDASIAYVATRSPISNTFARYENAVEKKRAGMMKNNTNFFSPIESIHEANPQEILERRELVTLLPLLIMQGALDDNVLPAVQERFVNTYRAAGGFVTYTVFEDSIHEWTPKLTPQTLRAQEMARAFIARNLAAGQRARV